MRVFPGGCGMKLTMRHIESNLAVENAFRRVGQPRPPRYVVFLQYTRAMVL